MSTRFWTRSTTSSRRTPRTSSAPSSRRVASSPRVPGTGGLGPTRRRRSEALLTVRGDRAVSVPRRRGGRPVTGRGPGRGLGRGACRAQRDLAGPCSRPRARGVRRRRRHLASATGGHTAGRVRCDLGTGAPPEAHPYLHDTTATLRRGPGRRLRSIRRKAPAIHVDHRRGAGRVRGVPCINCNSAIGKLGDDPDAVRRAAAYWKDPRGSQHS
ncbi:endonuclease domain-containing protein [Streptomyces sp. NPDC048566]|uniref:endonuclease domain-containing protein n=1 Tax=Streptomyces sp. NPDC048566 TaxID=3365569 RepID=UPI003711ECDA